MTVKLAYLFLGISIASEITATMFIKTTDNFTRLGPSIVVILGYVVSFYFLSYVLKIIPVGISYAIWSGLGIVATTGLAWVYFKQRLDVPALIGLAFILVGVLIINLFSKSAAVA